MIKCSSCGQPIIDFAIPFMSVIDFRERPTCGRCVDLLCEPVAVIAQIKTIDALEGLEPSTIADSTGFYRRDYMALPDLVEYRIDQARAKRRRILSANAHLGKLRRSVSKLDMSTASPVKDTLDELARLAASGRYCPKQAAQDMEDAAIANIMKKVATATPEPFHRARWTDQDVLAPPRLPKLIPRHPTAVEYLPGGPVKESWVKRAWRSIKGLFWNPFVGAPA